MNPSMSPSCSSAMMRFTTLVNPNTANTRAEMSGLQSDSGQVLSIQHTNELFQCFPEDTVDTEQGLTLYLLHTGSPPVSEI